MNNTIEIPHFQEIVEMFTVEDGDVTVRIDKLAAAELATWLLQQVEKKG